jgi:hypothetical protein
LLGSPDDIIDHLSILHQSLTPDTAYAFPEHRTDLAVLRVVVRNGFTHDLADLLLADLRSELLRLSRQSTPQRGTDHGAASP